MDALLLELMRGVNEMFLKSMGNTVRHGPFKGMVIPPPKEESWADGNFSTKVLGCYEFELHDAIAHAMSRNPKTVINVGCADGYYAIGLARLMPEVKVIAVDENVAAVNKCREYAERNGVGASVDVVVGSTMGLPDIPGRRLYFIDVEGDELKLIDLQQCPQLITSDIIVECHDFLDKDISLKLSERLAESHAVEIIRARLPLFSRYEFLNQTPGIMQVLMVQEKRPMPTLWLACWANRKGDDNG
jgi:SAM-dependent methyltransferase